MAGDSHPDRPESSGALEAADTSYVDGGRRSRRDHTSAFDPATRLLTKDSRAQRGG